MQNEFLSTSKKLLEITDAILGNETIIKLLGDSSRNALKGDKSKKYLENPYRLLDEKKVNPFPYIHEKTEDMISWVNVTTGYINKGEENPLTRNNQLVITVVSHSDIWIMNDGLRPLLIANEIDNILHRSREFKTLGQVTYDWGRPIVLNSRFYGYELFYKFYN